MFDEVFGFARVTASTISAATKSVLLNLDAGGSDKDPDHWPEFTLKQALMSAVGLIARPRPPSKLKGSKETSALETLFVRLGNGVLPIAFRDRRLSELYPNPKEGSVALVGYGGAFDSNEAAFDADEQPKSSTRTIYVPYAFQAGVPTKAHAIVIDGTAGNESISIVHGDGMAITMMHGGKNSVVMKNKAGDGYVEVNDAGVTVNGNTVINGGATIGSPTAAVPLALATQLAAYLAQLEIDIPAAILAVGAALAANGATGAAAFTSGAAARAALSALIPAKKASAI